MVLNGRKTKQKHCSWRSCQWKRWWRNWILLSPGLFAICFSFQSHAIVLYYSFYSSLRNFNYSFLFCWLKNSALFIFQKFFFRFNIFHFSALCKIWLFKNNKSIKYSGLFSKSTCCSFSTHDVFRKLTVNQSEKPCSCCRRFKCCDCNFFPWFKS